MSASGRPLPEDLRLLRAFLADVLLATALFVLAAALVVVLAIHVAGLSPEEDGSDMLLLIVVPLAVAACGTYLLRRRASRGEIIAANAAIARGSTWLWIVLVLLLLQLLGAAMGWLESISELSLEAANAQPIVGMLASQPWPTLLAVVLVGPFFEELLFRRVLFGRFLAAGRPLAGYLLSGALFASLHEFPGLSQGEGAATVVLWLFYFAMAWAMAWVYRRTGSLWAPVVVHMAHNALAMGMLG